VLKIDLLPRTFAQARTNKLLLVAGLVALLLCAGFWLNMSLSLQRQIAQTEAKIEEVKPIATEVDKLTSELNQKKAELQPIADKVSFVKEADKSGEIYWDQYHKIKRYIYGRAQMTSFSITPPNSVSFNVTLRGTTEYARFLLNLLRCPYMTLTSFQPLSAGRGIPASEEPEKGEWPTARGKIAEPGTTSAAPRTAAVGPMGMEGGMVPGMGPVGPPPEAMGGSAPPPGMMMGPGPAGEPGMMAGGQPGAGGATATPETQEINLQVSGTLLASISVPAPKGAAPAGGAGMGPGMMGEPGMMGGPGMGGPGGPPGPPGPSGPPPGGPPEGGGDEGGEE